MFFLLYKIVYEAQTEETNGDIDFKQLKVDIKLMKLYVARAKFKV